MQILFRVLLLLNFVFFLSACSVFSPVKTEKTASYVLNILPQPIIKKPVHTIALLVAQTTTSEMYNTTQMAYTAQPYQIAYFAKSRWADTPAQMLQLLLVQSLQNTHYFHAIGLPPVLGQYDYVLNTQLLQFEQRFLVRSSEVFMLLRAQIIQTSNNRVIAAKQFSVVETAPENTPYGGVVAANQAAAKILKQLVTFCLSAIN